MATKKASTKKSETVKLSPRADLEAKIRELIQRGHLFQKELALVQKMTPTS